MITTSTAPFVLEDSSQNEFNGSSIVCEPVYFELQTKLGVRLNVIDSADSNVIAYGYIELTNAEVDAETGSGTGETAIWFNAVQKAVITKLSAITGNGSVTFTIV